VLTNPIYHFKRIGLEAGPLSQWLFSALAEASLPVRRTVRFVFRGGNISLADGTRICGAVTGGPTKAGLLEGENVLPTISNRPIKFDERHAPAPPSLISKRAHASFMSKCELVFIEELAVAAVCSSFRERLRACVSSLRISVFVHCDAPEPFHVAGARAVELHRAPRQRRARAIRLMWAAQRAYPSTQG
jgi:hypothetical protein